MPAIESSMTPTSEPMRPPSKAAVTFLAGDRWKRKQQEVIVGHGGSEMANGIGVESHILRKIRALRYVRHPRNHALMNKMGYAAKLARKPAAATRRSEAEASD